MSVLDRFRGSVDDAKKRGGLSSLLARHVEKRGATGSMSFGKAIREHGKPAKPGLFDKGGFFDDVTRKIDKATGGIAGDVFNAVKKNALPIAGAVLAPITGGASLVPTLLGAGGGKLVQTATGLLDNLGETKVGQIASAALRDGVVKSDKIAETLLKSGLKAGKNEVHAIANSVSHGIADNTGKAVSVRPMSITAPSRDTMLTPYKETFMDKVKRYWNVAVNHVKENWIWYTGAVVLIGLYFVVKPMFGRKKWRV